MVELIEKTQEQNSEFTVIGKFSVPQKELHKPLYITVRDYSLDASRIEFWAESPEKNGWVTTYYMEVDTPNHGNTVLHSLIAAGAAGTITDDWLLGHGWVLEEEKTDE